MMKQGTPPPTTKPLADSERVASIVREVLARLTNPETTRPDHHSMVISDQVISVDTVRQIPKQVNQLIVGQDSLVTPAASDELASRQIKLQRHGQPAEAHHPRDQSHELRITDTANPQRAVAVAGQLERRGVPPCNATIVLSETPARDVHHYGTLPGERAAMINALSDVDRFAAELNPTVWVLDMARINFVAAVNIVTRISTSLS